MSLRSFPRLPAPWRLLGFCFALATVFGVIGAAEHHVQMVNKGGDVTIAHAIAQGMPYWYVWAVLAPLVIWFARRVPIRRPGLGWRIGAHVAAAAVFTILHATLHEAVSTAIGLMNQASVLEFTQSSLARAFFSLGVDLIVYAAILGAYYAFTLAERLKEREIAASRLAAQLAQARLDALQSQLKPHFFFNAMNTVAMLVRAHDEKLALRTLAGMSDLLRHILQEDPPALVPLREELSFIERYLEIEQIRFHDRLQVAVEADEATLDTPVPNLLLQPLVENAVKHGVSRRAGASRIWVRATLAEARLRVVVADDGPGFSSRRSESRGEGVGLRNTRARLQEMYGERGRLELSDAPAGGALVTIELPVTTPAAVLEPAPA